MKQIKKIVLLPLYFLSIFTGSNSFIANPVIGSKILNYCGLHVFRILLSHLVTRLRWTLLFWKMPASWRQEFHQNGFVVINNFLDSEKFTLLRHSSETVRQGPVGPSQVKEALLCPWMSARSSRTVRSVMETHFLSQVT